MELRADMDDLFVAVLNTARGASSPPVTKSLEDPAKAAIKAIGFCKVQGGAKDDFDALCDTVGTISLSGSEGTTTADEKTQTE